MTSHNSTITINTSIPVNYATVPEAYILLFITALGCLGNIIAIGIIVLCRNFRKSSTAFICHQCFLDCVKSIYNFIYGYNLLQQSQMPICYAVGASYVFFVTVSAYNLLAIVVNEEFEIQSPSTLRGKNHFCVLFGVLIVWFSCLLIDMGVAFLPKEPEFIAGIGNCIFSYGTPSNFVLHLLWIILVSIAIFIALSHFITMYCRMKYKIKSVKWALIHRSLLHEVHNTNDDLDLQAVQRSCHSTSLYTHLYQRRISLLLAMVACFVVFWYPLFTLTIIDYDFQQPKLAYRVLTLLSWCHPATTPIFAFTILIDMANKDRLLKRVYTNIYPMMDMYKHASEIANQDWDNITAGIQNTYYNTESLDLSDQPERQVLLDAEQDERIMIEVDMNETVEVDLPVVIEQWDRSPTSPGKRQPLHSDSDQAITR